MVRQVLLGVVGQVFASVVSAQHFDLLRARARVVLMKQQTLVVYFPYWVSALHVELLKHFRLSDLLRMVYTVVHFE